MGRAVAGGSGGVVGHGREGCTPISPGLPGRQREADDALLAGGGVGEVGRAVGVCEGARRRRLELLRRVRWVAPVPPGGRQARAGAKRMCELARVLSWDAGPDVGLLPAARLPAPTLEANTLGRDAPSQRDHRLAPHLDTLSRLLPWFQTDALLGTVKARCQALHVAWGEGDIEALGDGLSPRLAMLLRRGSRVDVDAPRHPAGRRVRRRPAVAALTVRLAVGSGPPR